MFLASDSLLASFLRYSGVPESLRLHGIHLHKENDVAPTLHFIPRGENSEIVMKSTSRPDEKKLGKPLIGEALSASSTTGIQASATKETPIAPDEVRLKAR
jgi:hypothetical protein